MSAVPPLPGLQPVHYAVQRVPGTQLVFLAIQRHADEAPGGLVMPASDARELARKLQRATAGPEAAHDGRGRRGGRGRRSQR